MGWSLLSNWSENKEGIIKLGVLPPSQHLTTKKPLSQHIQIQMLPLRLTFDQNDTPWHPGLTFSQKQTPGIEAWQKPPAHPCPKHTAEGEGRRRARTDAEAHTQLHDASSHLTTFSPQHVEALRLSDTYPNIRKPTL